MAADLAEVCTDMGAFLLERALLLTPEEMAEALALPGGTDSVCRAIENVARRLIVRHCPEASGPHVEWMATFAVTGCRKRLQEIAPLIGAFAGETPLAS